MKVSLLFFASSEKKKKIGFETGSDRIQEDILFFPRMIDLDSKLVLPIALLARGSCWILILF